MSGCLVLELCYRSFFSSQCGLSSYADVKAAVSLFAVDVCSLETRRKGIWCKKGLFEAAWKIHRRKMARNHCLYVSCLKYTLFRSFFLFFLIYADVRLRASSIISG